jgi:spermine/spermidine synthase
MRRDVGIFVLSVAVLLMQICLTKIFSFILWYHFGFLAISSALLGFSAAGVYLTLFPGVLRRDPMRVLGALAVVGGIVTVFVFALILRLQFNPLLILSFQPPDHVLPNWTELARFAGFVAVLMVPFFFMGLMVSLAISSDPAHVGRIYFANLLGSGVGCLVSIPMLDVVGGDKAVIVCAALVALSGVGFLRRGAVVPLVVGLALLAVGYAAPPHWFPLKSPKEKPLARVPAADRLYSAWTSLARVDFYTLRGERKADALWGLSSRVASTDLVADHVPDRKGIVIDAWAMTSITNLKGEPRANPGLKFIEYLPATLVYRLTGDTAPRVVALGAGGGLDILSGLYFGASHVTGVEINRSIVDAVKAGGEFATFAGGLYDRPDVTVHIDEGRHFLEKSQEKFDIVQVSGVDTYSSTQAGAYNLSENFLYTREAFDCYFRRVKDDGILTLTRWYLPSPWSGLPRFSMRLAVLAWDSLKALGVQDPSRNMVFAQSGQFTVILLKKQPFTAEELNTLEAAAREYDYGFFYLPGRQASLNQAFAASFKMAKAIDQVRMFDAFFQAKDKERFVDDYYFDVSAPTDDRPFFFELYKWGHILDAESFVGDAGITGQGILFILFGELLVLSTVFVLLPLWILGRRHLAIPGRASLLVYFSALGLGYILVEIVLSQRFILFLGHPIYALSVVLSGLLFFSGLGSLTAGRIGLRGGWAQRIAILGILGVGVAYAFGLPVLFKQFLHADALFRVLLSFALLAPLGFLMGMPFPLGITRLKERKELVAWAWGVNGYFSVLGSVLSIILGLAFGFTWVLVIALIVYGIALLVAHRFGGAAA